MQTCRALQKRFGEHDRRMKKPKPIDTFLYRHFKLTGYSPNDVLVQPVENLTYDKNSLSRFKIIKRHETELKWIKLLQTPFPLGFNDNIYHEGNISKMPDFDVFSLLEIRKRKSKSHGIRKKGNGKRKKKRAVKKSNHCSMFPLAFDAGSLQGHWWGFISRNYVVWPTFLLMNVFIALKGSHFWFYFT